MLMIDAVLAAGGDSKCDSPRFHKVHVRVFLAFQQPTFQTVTHELAVACLKHVVMCLLQGDCKRDSPRFHKSGQHITRHMTISSIMISYQCILYIYIYIYIHIHTYICIYIYIYIYHKSDNPLENATGYPLEHVSDNPPGN